MPAAITGELMGLRALPESEAETSVNRVRGRVHEGGARQAGKREGRNCWDSACCGTGQGTVVWKQEGHPGSGGAGRKKRPVAAHDSQSSETGCETRLGPAGGWDDRPLCPIYAQEGVGSRTGPCNRIPKACRSGHTAQPASAVGPGHLPLNTHWSLGVKR